MDLPDFIQREVSGFGYVIVREPHALQIPGNGITLFRPTFLPSFCTSFCTALFLTLEVLTMHDSQSVAIVLQVGLILLTFLLAQLRHLGYLGQTLEACVCERVDELSHGNF